MVAKFKDVFIYFLCSGNTESNFEYQNKVCTKIPTLILREEKYSDVIAELYKLLVVPARISVYALYLLVLAHTV